MSHGMDSFRVQRHDIIRRNAYRVARYLAKIGVAEQKHKRDHWQEEEESGQLKERAVPAGRYAGSMQAVIWLRCEACEEVGEIPFKRFNSLDAGLRSCAAILCKTVSVDFSVLQILGSRQSSLNEVKTSRSAQSPKPEQAYDRL